MTATDPIATLERGLSEWRKWALEPAELDALLWCEQALELLRDRLQAEPTTGFRQWVNTERTMLVRLWTAGGMEAIFRQHQAEPGGSPVMLREEQTAPAGGDRG